MTRDETVKILSVLKCAYPNADREMPKMDAENTLTLWGEMLDEPYPVVAMAVKSFIAVDTKGFPPAIGQVKEKIRQITSKAEMTEQEAWSLVTKAVSNSLYNSEEEYQKLPPLIRKLVHAPSQLRQWAMEDESNLQTVIASNFMRSFRARSKQAKDFSCLPGDVQDAAMKMNPSLRDAYQLDGEKPLGLRKPFEPGPEELEAIQQLMSE